jgi:hypothetical protein
MAESRPGDTPASTPTRESLLVLHEAARRRRHAAPLGGKEWEAASDEVARLEIEIARIERAMVPPKG